MVISTIKKNQQMIPISSTLNLSGEFHMNNNTIHILDGHNSFVSHFFQTVVFYMKINEYNWVVLTMQNSSLEIDNIENA